MVGKVHLCQEVVKVSAEDKFQWMDQSSNLHLSLKQVTVKASTTINLSTQPPSKEMEAIIINL